MEYVTCASMLHSVLVVTRLLLLIAFSSSVASLAFH